MSDPFGNDGKPNVQNVPLPTDKHDFQAPPGDGFPSPQNPEEITPAGHFTNPPVPGDQGDHGKDQTTADTRALMTFAGNMDLLADQLKQLVDPLARIQLKPGVFSTAQERIIDPILGSGRLRDNTVTQIQNLVTDLHDLSDAVAKAAKSYESIDEFNKISMDKYNEYFGQVSGEINASSGQ
jgi:hypothetical protein